MFDALITESTKLVAEVHGHMPVILEPKNFEQWERGNLTDASALMKPAAEDLLQKWPVSKRVNSSRTSDDDPTLIERADGVLDQSAIVATMHAVARRIGNIE
jgi:putative SOS response-associated peptidase YedK